jgi:DNA-binding transcriptional MerR regulator
VRTIRYWSDIGAVPPAGCSDGGHRLYDVAAAHVAALDAQIQSLRLARAVLSAAARLRPDTEEMTLMNKLRLTTPELPAEPTSEQVAAWVELAELVQDPGFRRRMRAMAQRR